LAIFDQDFGQKLRKKSANPDEHAGNTAHFCDKVAGSRDNHYPVCWLDIRQDSEFATGYGYPKTGF